VADRRRGERWWRRGRRRRGERYGREGGSESGEWELGFGREERRELQWCGMDGWMDAMSSIHGTHLSTKENLNLFSEYTNGFFKNI